MAGGRVPSGGQIVTTAFPLGAGVAGKVLFVNKVGSDGWVSAGRRNDPGKRVALHKYTKVTLIETQGGRTFFKVADGHAKGQVLFLSDHNATEHLGSKAPTKAAAAIEITYGKYVQGWVSAARGGQKLDQQMATLKVGNLTVEVTMNSVWGTGFTPLAPGKYSVLLPDAPHNKDMTRFYRDTEPKLKFDQVWFPIKHGDNSRFIHVGNVSDGCVTVLDLARWADVHEALISHRDPASDRIGELEIKGKPERAS